MEFVFGPKGCHAPFVMYKITTMAIKSQAIEYIFYEMQSKY